MIWAEPISINAVDSTTGSSSAGLLIPSPLFLSSPLSAARSLSRALRRACRKCSLCSFLLLPRTSCCRGTSCSIPAEGSNRCDDADTVSDVNLPSVLGMKDIGVGTGIISAVVLDTFSLLSVVSTIAEAWSVSWTASG
jgi:hypothetical protein